MPDTELLRLEIKQGIFLFFFLHIDFHKANKINALKPNDPYRGRTAPLTSKRCILYIFSNKYML